MKNKNAILIVSIALSGFSSLISGCSSVGPMAKQQEALPKEKVDASALYAESCATCHGKDGRAGTFHGWLVGAQNFTDPTWQTNSSDDEIIHAIKTGPKAMPAFENKLSGPEIEALAAYVRAFKPAQ